MSKIKFRDSDNCFDVLSQSGNNVVAFSLFSNRLLISEMGKGENYVYLSKSELEDLINHLTELKNKMQ